MIKLGIVKAITTPIKNVFNKVEETVNGGGMGKAVEAIKIINIGKTKIKETICIPLVPETMCYDIYEDGYIQAVK
jgi:hypothetical protein